MIDRASAARRGLLAIFAADGALFASWASRLPQVQDNIHADAADLGFALAGTAIGALSAMFITGVVCHHWAPYRVACVMLLALCLLMVLPATADSPLSLGLALLVFGACYGATDVAMNSAAVELSVVIDRPIVPQFHSAYPRRQPGRPPTAPPIRALALRMARENPDGATDGFRAS